MKTLIWLVPFCAGGLCDRLLGLISSYCIAEEIGRKILIKWDQTDMSSVIPIKHEHNYYNYNLQYHEDLKMNVEYMNYFQNCDVKELWKNYDNVLIWSNLNTFSYFCKTRPRIPYQERFLSACKNVFSLFFDIIPEVETRIPDVSNSIGIHIRTHDNQIKVENEDNRKKQIPYIKNVLEMCKNHIEKEGQNISTIFIASDCVISVSLARIIFGPEYTILSTTGPIVHSGFNKDKEGLIRVVADLLSLSRCKTVYLGWNSNFSRIGALINPERNFFLYEKQVAGTYLAENISKVSVLELMNYYSQPDRKTEEYN